MGNDPNQSSQTPHSSSDELSEYLQVFLDESVEELDSLVESVLMLEGDPRNSDALNKSFRMLHSLKGSCGMMGYEVVGNFAHALEDRFESYRSGKELLDRDTTTLVLRCVDFFRSFIDRLRQGDSNEGDPAELYRQLNELSKRNSASTSVTAADSRNPSPSEVCSPFNTAMSISGGLLITINFKPGLQLADLKARLIVSRLSTIGEVVACEPRIEDVHSVDELPLFSLTLLTDRKLDEVRRIVNVDGVESIQIDGASLPDNSTHTAITPASSSIAKAVLSETSCDEDVDRTADFRRGSDEVPAPNRPASAGTSESTEGKGQANETLRVDIDRLDRLMNLTGELIVTNARFAQITSKMNPVFRRNSVFNKSRDLTEKLRQRFQLVRQQLDHAKVSEDAWDLVFAGLEEELDGLDQQSALWDEGNRQFLQITEAVDQLSRVSKNIQRGVLNTRMVPVGPLLNRFKRVIRDLSVERGKRVQLVIQGEKTELDRRMIDSLGDPLLHLIRNSIDHGLESTDQRRASGKPEVGTINLAAVHRGNNVLITVEDDGAGIDTEKIRARIVARGLATEVQAREMTEPQIVDYIWHPGFSTAERVTDISGRGVGMDIVRNAITGLSGSIDVTSTLGKKTVFTIRLPLTLAIIRSLLIQFRGGFFSIPIDDVREIVSVSPESIYTIHRHLAIDVRGELIPLVTMENIFEWNSLPESAPLEQFGLGRNINVVLLHSRGKTLGVRVDALVGRADIVIKSLTENFVAIRGISGASVMGDGDVCLMLDCAALHELASERAVSVGSNN